MLPKTVRVPLSSFWAGFTPNILITLLVASCLINPSAEASPVHRSTSAYLKLIGMPSWAFGDKSLLVLAANLEARKEYALVLQRSRTGFVIQHRVAEPFGTRSAQWVGQTNRAVLEVRVGRGKPNQLLLLYLKTARRTPLGTGFEPIIKS